MPEIEERIALAKKDKNELNQLIKDYIPFIKKMIAQLNSSQLDYDERFSLAMLVFMSCIQQYELERGNFIAFATVCIRNRLIDESRKQQKWAKKRIPLFRENEEIKISAEEKVSIAAYNKEKERMILAEEINHFSIALQPFGISFVEMPKISPKQARSRRQCFELAKAILADDRMKATLLKHHQIPQKELAAQFGISVKTIEKHRKYLIVVVLLLLGDYPGIQSFLSVYKEVQS